MQTEAIPAAASPTVPVSPPAPAATPEPKAEPGVSPEAKANILGRARAGLPAKQAKAPEPAKPADEAPAGAAPSAEPAKADPDQEYAERLATLVKEDRRLRATKDRVEADRKAAAADLAIVKAVREARTSGDRVGMLKALFPGEDLSEEVFWDLVKSLKEDDGTVSPEALGKLVDTRLEEKLAERTKQDRQAAEDSATKELGEARSFYAEACAKELGEAVAQYPLVQAQGFTVEEMERHVIGFRRKTGRVPEPKETLEHFEATKAKQLEGTPYRRQEAAAPAKPGATVSKDWTRDSRGSVAPSGAPVTLDEKREAMRVRLRSMRG